MDRQLQSHGNLHQSNRKEGNMLFEISIHYLRYAKSHEFLKPEEEMMEFNYLKKSVSRYLVEPRFVDGQRISTR